MGLNILRQDVLDTSSEPNNMLPLIAKLSFQTNSEAVEQLELGAL